MDTARRGLLKKYTDATKEVRVGRPLSDVEIIKCFFREIGYALVIKRSCMIFTDLCGSCLIDLWDEWISSFRHAGHEEVSTVPSHFMKVHLDIWLPTMKYF